MTSSAVTGEYRELLDKAVLLALNDVVELWKVAPSDARALVAALIDNAPAITDTYGSIAATLGADLYDELRRAARARGTYVATPAAPAPVGQVQALARWAVGPLFDEEPNPDTALAYFAGGIERLVRQPFRRSVLDNSGADRASIGVIRIAQPGACIFCSALADDVLFVNAAGESEADHWHRSCKCTPAPAF